MGLAFFLGKAALGVTGWAAQESASFVFGQGANLAWEKAFPPDDPLGNKMALQQINTQLGAIGAQLEKLGVALRQIEVDLDKNDLMNGLNLLKNRWSVYKTLANAGKDTLVRHEDWFKECTGSSLDALEPIARTIASEGMKVIAALSPPSEGDRNVLDHADELVGYYELVLNSLGSAIMMLEFITQNDPTDKQDYKERALPRIAEAQQLLDTEDVTRTFEGIFAPGRPLGFLRGATHGFERVPGPLQFSIENQEWALAEDKAYLALWGIALEPLPGMGPIASWSAGKPFTTDGRTTTPDGRFEYGSNLSLERRGRGFHLCVNDQDYLMNAGEWWKLRIREGDDFKFWAGALQKRDRQTEKQGIWIGFREVAEGLVDAFKYTKDFKTSKSTYYVYGNGGLRLAASRNGYVTGITWKQPEANPAQHWRIATGHPSASS